MSVSPPPLSTAEQSIKPDCTPWRIGWPLRLRFLTPSTRNTQSLTLAAPTATAERFQEAWQRFQRHAQKATLCTGRYALRYFTWGKGQPVVFIHGMADAPEAFVAVMDQLCTFCRCVAYALPNGWNDSVVLSRYRLQDYVADLLVLLDHLSITEAVLVGSSFGSLVTIYALMQLPQRCRAGVLQNGFAYRPLCGWEMLLVRWGRRLPGWFADWPYLYDVVMRQLEPVLATQVPDVVGHLYRWHGAHTPISAAAWRGWMIGRTDLRPLLPRIRQPVLLVTGDRDRLVPPQCWQELQRLLPLCYRVDIPGCGHYPQYTHPLEMARAIAAFLRKTGTAEKRTN